MMIPVFQKSLSFVTAASLGVFCVITHALAYEHGIYIKSADSPKWTLEASLRYRLGQEAQLSPQPVEPIEQCISFSQDAGDGNIPISCNTSVRSNWYWYTVDPEANDYDNTSGCDPVKRGCVHPITYRIREVESLRGADIVTASDLVRLLGLGTHWVMTSDSELPLDERVVSTRERPSAFEFVARRNDSYIGYLTELLGVPFTYFPSLTSDGSHQTDIHLGADCVALVVYGQRRLGRKIPYMAPPALKRYTRLVEAIENQGQPVMEGDVISFGFQTAVISSDRHRIGILDGEDHVIHTYHGHAEEVLFSSLPYRDSPFTVRRWTD